jgi:AcrR family transcriptional regulator
MLSTKQRILLQAEKLFFEHGIANVRLQQIADSSGISVGNLAYHFNNKEAIVEAVYEITMEGLYSILVKSKIYPGLASFDDKFSNLFDFMKKNLFFYTNFWEIKRNFSGIDTNIIDINKKIISKLKKRLKDNLAREALKKEELEGSYDLLAKTLLFNINSWVPQQLLQGKKLSEEDFKTYMWNLIYPYLTAKGKKEFASL